MEIVNKRNRIPFNYELKYSILKTSEGSDLK